MKKIIFLSLLLIFNLLIRTTYGQRIEVFGTVTDTQTGNPLCGVNVVIDGTKPGTTTDIDGNYFLEALPNDTLVFSFVEYKQNSIQKKFISISGRQMINVALQTQDTKVGKVELLHKWRPPILPNPNPEAQWFPQAALGLFMHWGIVSGTQYGKTWEMMVYSEPDPKGFQPIVQTSPEKMFKRAENFNPTNYDPYDWMKAASAAGFRYAVLTTRHHDGYFLGDSKFGDWHAGHYMGRDLIAPYVDACRSNNIKVGFYWSGPDWYHGREYMSYNYPDAKNPPFYNWKHDKVNYIPPMPDCLREEVENIALGQIHELLTKYGKIDLFWPDGKPGSFTVKELRRLQPAAIWGRGGEYATPESWADMKMEYIKEANSSGYPWELCDIGHAGSWFWSEYAEQKGINAAQLISNLAKVRALGGNYLINIGPTPDGEMPHWFYPLCEQLAEWMKWGGEAIYDINISGPFPYPDQCAQPVTVGSNAWYVFSDTDPETFGAMSMGSGSMASEQVPKTKQLPKTNNQPIVIKNVEKPVSVILLRNGTNVPFEFDKQTLTIRIPSDKRTGLPDVLKIMW